MRVWKPAVRCLFAIALVAGALAIAPSSGSAATANAWPHTIVNGFSNPTGDGGWLTYADGTVTTFGTPLDVTVAELVIEAFYPADEATRQALHRG